MVLCTVLNLSRAPTAAHWLHEAFFEFCTATCDSSRISCILAHSCNKTLRAINLGILNVHLQPRRSGRVLPGISKDYDYDRVVISTQQVRHTELIVSKRVSFIYVLLACPSFRFADR